MRMSTQYDLDIDAIDPLDTMPPAKKSMVIFFMVDTSKSMEGSKLDSLNKVMGEILPELIGTKSAMSGCIKTKVVEGAKTPC